MRLWDLPGAARFLGAVVQSLRDGISVVLRFPGEIPRGFLDSVHADVSQFLRFSRFDGNGHDPLNDLCRKYAPGALMSGDDMEGLCAAQGFRGRLIWLDGLGSRNWGRWREFLSQYAQASRNNPTLGRTVFIAPLVGSPPEEPPEADVTLAVRDWKNVIDETDLLILALDRLSTRYRTTERLLLANAVARVASWDLHIAERLLNEKERTILAPLDMLCGMASERAWTTDTPAKWELGTASWSGSAHAALAALESPPRNINRRLWSAQVSVLLPAIESRRVQIVDASIKQIRTRQQQMGSVRNPYDLEIGDLKQLFRPGDHTRRTLEKLNANRNHLAHVNPMGPDRALECARLGRHQKPKG